ncbi:MAG TPA: aldolase/citrate lyase family protein [Gemmataceae bacterium]|nr:aldolase/citrate lyase family protein [Gemmataceae bacterium]
MVHVKELLGQGKLVRVFGVGQLCHPKIVEMIGYHGGFHAVWLDQEHAGLTLDQIEQAARAARASGIGSFVRLTATDYATVMRPLEAGAGGIMAAQVKSARQACEIVQWAKFFPLGMRGINSTGSDGRYGSMKLLDYMHKANAETFVAIQIEHADAVAEVEEIAAIPGVDVLFIGPADLSQSMSIPGEWSHPRFWQAVESVAQAARNHRIHWGILPPTKEHAARCVELGCRMLSLGLDVWAVQKGLRAFQAEFEAYFEST